MRIRTIGCAVTAALLSGDAGCSSDPVETEPPPDDCHACPHAVAISIGEGHACALSSDGHAYCWGENGSGQLGVGHTAPVDPAAGPLTPVDLGEGRSAYDLASGPQFNCAILDDLSVKCWGENGSGQLGTGDREARGDTPAELGDALQPVRDATGEIVRANRVAVGQGTACVIRVDNRVTCWGNNSYGQLGPTETAIDVPIPAAAIEVGTGLEPKRIAIGGPGGAHVCVVLAGARSGLKCWGYNGVGALGQGDTEPLASTEFGDAMPWVDLGGDFGAAPDQAEITDVVLGHRSSCALAPNGVVKCWGYGAYGLGSNNADLGTEPGQMGDALAAVPLGRSAFTIFAGGFHFCAQFDDFTVMCWGRNDAGQLGVEATDDRGDEPEPLSRALLATGSLGGGGDELATCVLDGEGGIWCWGGGTLGRGLGDAPGEMAAVVPVRLPEGAPASP
jgi:alpha-tubulin suppressor-like RCC1 family protein